MANTDAVATATVTLDTADEADTVTFSNYAAAVRVINREQEGAVFVRLNGDAEADGADSYFVPPGGSRVLRAGRQRVTEVSFIGESGATPKVTVERVNPGDFSSYDAGVNVSVAAGGG